MAPHLVVSQWKDKMYFSRISCSGEEEWSETNLAVPFPGGAPKKVSPYVVGSCNGLLCISYSVVYSNASDGECVVWDQSTGMFQVMPPPNSLKIPCGCGSKRCENLVMSSGCGLGFDAVSQDYKFVSFTSNYYMDSDDDGDVNGDGDLHHRASDHVAVYSVKNNSWKELPIPLFKEKYEMSTDGPMGVCVNGVCYLFGMCDVNDPLILAFDLATEKFSTFHYPDNNLADRYSLIELDGSLGLVFYPMEKKKKVEELEELEEEEGIMIRFWVYSSSSSSWTRKTDFDVRLDGFYEPLWFGKMNNRNGYSLLLRGSHGALLEYDYAKGKLNKIHQIHQHPGSSLLRVFPYVETETITNANIWHRSVT